MHIVSPTDVSLTKPENLVFQGSDGERLTVYVLDHNLIRVRHLPDGTPRLDRTWWVGNPPREGRQRDDLSGFPLPDVAVEAADDGVHVHTDLLQLHIHTTDFRIDWSDSDGRLFHADARVRAYAYDRRGRTIFHYLQRRHDEHYYGFGEKAGPLDKAGMRMKMQNVDAFGYDAETSDPLYKHIPFYITFIPELDIAYGLFYDNMSTCIFDMGREVNALHGSYSRHYQASDGDLDYYLIYGPTIEAVIEKYTDLTGRPALPPRWSLGYLGSTMKYTEAPDAQDQLKQFVDLCQQYDIPCDMFHLSSGYTTDSEGRRCVFTWNRDRIPDPAQMVAHFKEAGIRLGANIKPYLLQAHPLYEDLLEKGGFLSQAEGRDPEINLFWSSGDYQFEPGGYIDFTNPAGYDWWKAHATSALLDYGIEVLWNDNNEFEVLDDEAQCEGFGGPIRVGMARPLLTLLMARASFEATQAHWPDERPLVLSRAGCPGIQRYVQTWTGDNYTSWESLRYNIPMGLGLSLSGLPNNGHDVGGFAGPKPTPELFVRWVQNGIFHPRFCIHSHNSDGTVNEPWMYPEVLPIIRDTIKFRYRLLPYLYSLFFESYLTGHPIIRPMVYHFAHDPQCRTESFDFMLGPNLLVASVLEPGVRSRRVYLPQGTNWYDFNTNEFYEGGQTIRVDAPLEQIPMFARAGSIIPLARDGALEAYAFPPKGEGRGTFVVVEDDGIGLGYQREEYATLKLEIIATEQELNLVAEINRTHYDPHYTDIRFILPANETRPVKGNSLKTFTARPPGPGQ